MLGLQHVVTLDIRLQHIAVAPPRGVRGLKFAKMKTDMGAAAVAPPRGVRELKLQRLGKGEMLSQSHPLVGCV